MFKGRLISFFLLTAVAAWANVCTPLNVPANGPFPAVVNGIDAVGWGDARIEWTSDATSGTPATGQRINYATAAQWAANPSVYPQTQGMGSITVSNSSVVQGSTLPNLLPGTTYHVQGQSYQGGAWCSAPDETFTTLPAPVGVVLPTLPATIPGLTTAPAMTYTPPMTGTHWVYGANCGTGGTTTQNVQDCFNKAQPGDDIGFAPGVYAIGQIQIPNNPNAVAITCVTSGSVCSLFSGGTIPANGTGVRFFDPPPPVNPGVTYKTINATSSTFQISYDGVNPITFQANSAYPTFFVPYPLTQGWIVVHSTASSSVLPPAGVRLDASTLAEYEPNMPAFQMTDPFLQPMLVHDYLAGRYWYQNAKFTVDPSIANSNAGNGVDPVGYNNYVNTFSTNDSIIYNQCAFDPPGPPTRTWFMGWDGSNIGLFNSYVGGLDFWQPFRAGTGTVVTSSNITISPTTYSWVGTGGTIGTKKSCSYSGGTLNITGGGSGSYVIYMDPTTCLVDAQVSSGITASGTNITVTSVASPAYPTYTYTSPTSHVYTALNVLTMGDGTVTSGAINTGSYNERFGISGWATDQEGGGGFHVATGPGPFMTVNNYIQGAGITGMFFSDDLSNGSSPCGNVTPCPIQYNVGDVTEQRNTITTNVCYFAGSSCWNGGNYSWRNMDEVKSAARVWQDGNIWGPYYAQVGQGECGGSHYEYNGWPNFLATPGGYPSYVSSGNWTYTNNTCNGGASAGIYTGLFYYAEWPAYPINNVRIHNSLFLNVNGYAQTSAVQPLQAQVQQSNTLANCPYGKITQWNGNGENFDFDHNTVYGEAGCLAWFESVYQALSSFTNLTNNIYNLVSDPGAFNANTQTGTQYQSYQGLGGGTADTPNCGGFQASALFACMNYFTWADNVILATWTNSFPGSLVEYNNSQIATAQSLFPANTYWPSAGSSLSARINQLGWFNTASNNFRLKSTSPYISGAKASTDGLDIGVNMDILEAAQGKVSNVHAYGSTSTSTTIGFLAPDSFGCGIDWGTSNFSGGAASYTRVTNSGGQCVQNVTLSSLPAHSLIYYRVNCAVQQPLGTVQLP